MEPMQPDPLTPELREVESLMEQALGAAAAPATTEPGPTESRPPAGQ